MGAVKGRHDHRAEEVFFLVKAAVELAGGFAGGREVDAELKRTAFNGVKDFIRHCLCFVHHEKHGGRRVIPGELVSVKQAGFLLAAGVFLFLLLSFILEFVRHAPVPAFRLAGVVGGKAFNESPFRSFYAAILEPFPTCKGRVVPVPFQGRPELVFHLAP